MNLLQATLLGLIQGLTEFLPVSSSGHLALVQYLMHIPQVSISFDVLLHLGTLVAVIIMLFPDIYKLAVATIRPLFKGKIKEIPRLFWLLIIGSIPAAILGFLLNDYMDSIFSSVRYFSIGFLITSILLTIASRIKPSQKTLSKMSWKESIKIGLFQAVAILPSISRSGATISGTLFAGFSAQEAFTFSFLLSIPAILGASALHAKELLTISSQQIIPYGVGFIVAFLSGLLALKLFRRILIARKLSIFAYYCFFLSLLIFFFVR